jgi:hypothetical protein
MHVGIGERLTDPLQPAFWQMHIVIQVDYYVFFEIGDRFISPAQQSYAASANVMNPLR